MSRHMMSRHVISRHVMSRHAMSRHVLWCHVIWSHFTSLMICDDPVTSQVREEHQWDAQLPLLRVRHRHDDLLRPQVLLCVSMNCCRGSGGFVQFVNIRLLQFVEFGFVHFFGNGFVQFVALNLYNLWNLYLYNLWTLCSRVDPHQLRNLLHTLTDTELNFMHGQVTDLRTFRYTAGSRCTGFSSVQVSLVYTKIW